MVHPVKTCRKLKWYILSGSILGQTYILTSLPPYNPAVLQPKILGWWGLRLGVKNFFFLGFEGIQSFHEGGSTLTYFNEICSHVC